MKQRICDYCKARIKVREEFIKLRKTSWKGHRMRWIDAGDMCIKCYKAGK